jgi:hypothetical protein
MPETKKTTPSATSHEDLLSLLKTTHPDATIRITRYPDETEIIEIFPPWRAERGKPEKVNKPHAAKYPFDDQGKGVEAPDWLQKAETETSRKK